MNDRLTHRQIPAAAAGSARGDRAAVRPAPARPVAQHRDHGGGARDRRDGAQSLRRLHRSGLVRPRHLVRHRRLCRRADPAALVSRRDLAAAAAVDDRGGGGLHADRHHHPAAARRVFLAADAGARRADLHHRLPLEQPDRRRRRPRRPETRQHRAHQSRRYAQLLHRGRPCSASACSICCCGWCARRSAMCWWRSARTSCAPPSRAIRSNATSSACS